MKGLDFTQCHSSFPSSTWWGHAAIVLVSIDLRGHPLDFQPGQAVMVGEHGQPERRPYSIAWVGEMKVET